MSSGCTKFSKRNTSEKKHVENIGTRLKQVRNIKKETLLKHR